MAEITLAILALVVGATSLAAAFVFFLGNAMGGATDPSQVDHKPTVICIGFALVFIGAGIAILIN